MCLACWLAAVLGVPVIDMSPLLEDTLHASEKVEEVEQKIRDALQKNGLFLMVGHDIQGEYAEGVLQEARSLFSLPLEAKMGVKLDSARRMRGYIPYGAESGLKDSITEPKEGFAYGKGGVDDISDDSHNYLESPNLWPQGMGGQLMEKLYDACTSYSHAIMRAAFGSNDDRIESMLDGSEKVSLMRVFHYFAAASGDSRVDESGKEILGSSPHRDWGLLTLILQDAPGLEYFDGSDWKSVPYIPGSLVVNGGDFLNMISQKFHSPIHRVLAPLSGQRMSFVFFFYPSYQTLLPSSSPAHEVDSNGEEANEGGTAMEYNSLNSILQGEEEPPLQFGDAMVLKWKGVQA